MITFDDKKTMIVLRLPYPPSVNHYWRHIVSGRRVAVLISRQGQAYRTAVERIVMAQRSPRMTGRLAVLMHAYPPDRRARDLDNLPKAVLDALTHSGVWPDDGLIDDLHVQRMAVVRGGRLVVRIGPVPVAVEAAA